MIINHKDAQAAFTPTVLPPNVTSILRRTAVQVNQEAAEAMVTSASTEDLDDLIARLKKLYLAQCDRADETLRSLIKATAERRCRGG